MIQGSLTENPPDQQEGDELLKAKTTTSTPTYITPPAAPIAPTPANPPPTPAVIPPSQWRCISCT